ncbi:MAG: AMP-binding protein [Bacillota bacterium]
MNTESLSAELIRRGLEIAPARETAQWICQAMDVHRPQEAWSRICRQILDPRHDFALHAFLYEQCYGSPDATAPRGPAWIPPSDVIQRANITAALQWAQVPDYPSLHRWSVEHREAYWQRVIELLNIRLRQPFQTILDASEPTRPRWLPGARLNIVDSCFNANRDGPAIVYARGDDTLQQIRYGELCQLSGRVANALLQRGIQPGDAVAIVMPMTPHAVAIYLGILAAGAAVVSIADSFAPEEMATRLRIGQAKRVFTQDYIHRGGNRLPLYDKLITAGAPPAIVLGGQGAASVALRSGDQTWEAFLSADDRLAPVACNPGDAINILFSSGTTGEPKAIPWDHTTPLKCAADAFFHHDIHPGNVLCWPTSLGWMMGPWLIFAALLNRATIALTDQVPTSRGFGQFVQNAHVTMLGVVPSLVRVWRQSACMQGLDWSAIRAFSSTGESSNPQDMLYLMHLAGYRPVIEYCGGTEIGGAYITGTVVQPCVPATFSTPALGLDLVLLDEQNQPASRGEVFLIGPSIGLSTRLLNRDHDAVYFAHTPPGPGGVPLRRHGDDLERGPEGYYRVLGRSDDTMNLGGIKVGCAEIERVLNQLEAIQETAAIAIAPPEGGPSQLVIYAVLRPGQSVPVAELKPAMQQALRQHLNPLFKVQEVQLISALPRTASNKVMRRELRAEYRTAEPDCSAT